jgi:hypothetical protein
VPAAHSSVHFGGDLTGDVDRRVRGVGAARIDLDKDVVSLRRCCQTSRRGFSVTVISVAPMAALTCSGPSGTARWPHNVRFARGVMSVSSPEVARARVRSTRLLHCRVIPFNRRRRCASRCYVPSADHHFALTLTLHTGQAPQPCLARVTSAIASCSSRVARSARGAYRSPPCRFQVFWSNCTPP